MSCKNKGLLIKCNVERLINDPENAVQESLRGFAMVNTGLVVLDGLNAILRRDYDDMPNKVKLISGGGSGNEPTHCGFVGPGMLTAAVFGKANSAPTIDTIFNVIYELGINHTPGILLIVQYHPGYIVNFRLAKKRAMEAGIYVEILQVWDEASDTKSRGLLGTLFVHKIAGAMAEDGMELEDIVARCTCILREDITSIGICTRVLTSCTTELKCKEMEIGCGIHGEPGKTKVPFTSCHETVSILLKQLLESKESFSKHENIAVMISNLGGSSQSEVNIFTMEVLQQLTNFGKIILKVYVGSLMTSLNRNIGYHISLLNISRPNVLEYLSAKTKAPSWPKALSAQELGYTFNYDFSKTITYGKYINKGGEEAIDEDYIPVSPEGPCLTESSAKAFSTIITFACDALIACTNQLDIIDQEAGDGDCGTSLASGAKAIRNAATHDRLMTSYPGAALYQISAIVQKTMPGFQGGFYSLFIGSAAQVFLDSDEDEEITPELWYKALATANEAITDSFGTKEGDRSSMDSLMAAQKAFGFALSTKTCPIQSIGQAVKAAESQATLTVFMEPKVGRAALLKDQHFEHPDAGAHAVGIWMRAMYEGIKLQFPSYRNSNCD